MTRVPGPEVGAEARHEDVQPALPVNSRVSAAFRGKKLTEIAVRPFSEAPVFQICCSTLHMEALSVITAETRCGRHILKFIIIRFDPGHMINATVPQQLEQGNRTDVI